MPGQPLGVYRKDTAEEIYRAFQMLKSSGLLAPGVIQSLMSGEPRLTERPIYVTNTSGEEVPAYACMQIVGTEEIGGQNYLQIDKPADTDGSTGAFVFNDHVAIPADEEGVAQKGKVNLRAYKNSGTVTAGDRWAPTVNQWYLTQDDGGMFQAHGEDDISTNVFKVADISGNGSGSKIEYEIDSVTTAASGHYTGLKVATVTISVAPCDRPGLIGDSVDVVDHSGCLFNEANEDLVGREGWAFEGVALSLDAGQPAGTVTPCHWVADGLCCP